MRDSALKLQERNAILALLQLVGNELMRDSALKPLAEVIGLLAITCWK